MPEDQMKRLFFGFEVQAPWPTILPEGGRILEEKQRHMTVAFLGSVSAKAIDEALAAFPPPPFKIGFAGQFNQCLFLPKRGPHVVAWHIDWLENSHPLEQYQKQLVSWIKQHELPVDEKKNFLPHVTLCRSPRHLGKWRETFAPLPLMTGCLHLYESLGHSHYQPYWSYSLHLPFEEVDHTADIAFQVRGESLDQLYCHAQLALAFTFPPVLNFFSKKEGFESLDEVIIHLNELISRLDEKVGSPFKAISFHGRLVHEEEKLLSWEMIVDV